MASRRERLYLDSNIFIYAIEGSPEFAATLAHLFADIDNGVIEAVTSSLTLAEVLVKPLQRGDRKIEIAFRRALNRSASLRVEPISNDILIQAARIRATTSLRLPDAIHAATSRLTRCTRFVSNDGHFRSAAVRVLSLSDLQADFAALDPADLAAAKSALATLRNTSAVRSSKRR